MSDVISVSWHFHGYGITLCDKLMYNKRLFILYEGLNIRDELTYL